MSFNDTVLRFAASTRWDGPLDSATHVGTEGIPGDGPYAKIFLDIRNSVVAMARFQTYTCPASRASCAALCWVIEGKNVELCETVCASDVVLLLHGLPDGKGHLPEMALSALQKALSGTIGS